MLNVHTQVPLSGNEETDSITCHPAQINKLSIAMTLSQWPPVQTDRQTEKKGFIARNGGPTWPEDCFLSPFVQRREMGHPVQTKGFHSQVRSSRSSQPRTETCPPHSFHWCITQVPIITQ